MNKDVLIDVLEVLSCAEKRDVRITGIEVWMANPPTAEATIWGIPARIHDSDPPFAPIGDWLL